MYSTPHKFQYTKIAFQHKFMCRNAGKHTCIVSPFFHSHNVDKPGISISKYKDEVL